MKIKPLTKIQFETLDYLRNFYSDMGYMPSHSEISKSFGIKVGGGTTHRLESLAKAGYLKLTKGPRGITLTNPYERTWTK